MGANFSTSFILFLILLVVVLPWALLRKKLTLIATITAGAMALCIYAGTGLVGISLLGTFFFLGTLTTAWGKRQKQGIVADEGTAARNAGQVLANGGMATLLSLVAIVYPAGQQLLLMMIAGAFSAAAADTCSSELGVLYGRRFYNIRTLRPDKKGLDGVVSLEGTSAGALASLAIALVYVAGSNDAGGIMAIVVGGTAGNIADSLLGATLERKEILKNDAVNFLNTTVGTAVTAIWYNA